MIMYEKYLEALYDRHNSFYKKAKVLFEESGKIILRSYNTNVAYIENGDLFVEGLYSATTTRHIKEFMTQYGFDYKNASDIMKRYNAQRKNCYAFENM